MELETQDQININYNRFFYATMCHVCKRFGDDVPLKRCSGCRLISYCGREHQKQHWAQHKTLCKAIQDVLKDEGAERFDVTMKDWEFLKITLMQTVGEKMGYLKLYETEMFLFPKECAVCHDPNFESLVVCRNCAMSFCKNHEDDNAHKDDCDSLNLCLRTSLSYTDNENILNMYLQHISETTFTFQDMNDFIKNHGNIQEVHSEMSYDILAAGLSDHFTCPLTLLYAMKILDYIPKSKELVIHIITGSNYEEYTLKMWEILLHLIPETEVSLMIIMIGTELKHKSYSLSVCDNCLSRGKKISLEFHNELYEDYLRSPSFVKPDFAVGFYVAIQTDDTYVAEITMPSIKMLAEQNCPFLVTNHKQKKLEESINRINTILNREVDYVYSGKNPFASLRPYRCIRGPELVFCFNNFVTIYRSLCS